MTAKTAIRELLTEISATTGPVTDAAIADTRRRVATLCVLAGEQDLIPERLQSVDAIMTALQTRNRGSEIEATAGIPLWKTRVTSLIQSMEFLGLDCEMSSEHVVHVRAGVAREYPVGGTPQQVLLRAIPATPEIKLTKTLAHQLVEALGTKLNGFAFGVTVAKYARDPVGTRIVTVPRLEYLKLLTELFHSNPDSGWKARRTLLSAHEITEV